MSFFDDLLDLERTPAKRPYTAAAFDLAAYRKWVDDLGAPDRGLRFLHIAGTKGKGSTAAFCEAVLRAAGVRTLLYTSPHLRHFGERIRIDGRSLTAEEFETAMEALGVDLGPGRLELLRATPEYRTVFEVLTLLALMQAQRNGAEAVVWETGLGGRLDATNIVDPTVCAITTLGLDHCAILGDRIEQIAFEKSGIVKPMRPCVVGRQDAAFESRVMPLLEHRAESVGAPLYRVEELVRVERRRGGVAFHPLPVGERAGFPAMSAPPAGWDAPEVGLPLRGAHQVDNAALAFAAVRLFLRAVGRSTEPGRLVRGLGRAVWPGRFDVQRHPVSGRTLVLDGAHCPLSAQRLREALTDEAVVEGAGLERPCALLWGMQRDKDHGAFLQTLLGTGGVPLFAKACTYPVPGPRGATAEELAARCRSLGLETIACASAEDAVACALGLSGVGSLVAAGTLYSLASLGDAFRVANDAGGAPKVPVGLPEGRTR